MATDDLVLSGAMLGRSVSPGYLSEPSSVEEEPVEPTESVDVEPLGSFRGDVLAGRQDELSQGLGGLEYENALIRAEWGTVPEEERLLGESDRVRALNDWYEHNEKKASGLRSDLSDVREEQSSLGPAASLLGRGISWSGSRELAESEGLDAPTPFEAEYWEKMAEPFIEAMRADDVPAGFVSARAGVHSALSEKALEEKYGEGGMGLMYEDPELGMVREGLDPETGEVRIYPQTERGIERQAELVRIGEVKERTSGLMSPYGLLMSEESMGVPEGTVDYPEVAYGTAQGALAGLSFDPSPVSYLADVASAALYEVEGDHETAVDVLKWSAGGLGAGAAIGLGLRLHRSRKALKEALESSGKSPEEAGRAADELIEEAAASPERVVAPVPAKSRAVSEDGLWRSRLVSEAESMPAKLSVDGILDSFRGRGVTESEIRGTGLDEFVSAAVGRGERSVSRDDVLAHLEKNRLELGDVRLGHAPKEVREAQAAVDEAFVDVEALLKQKDPETGLYLIDAAEDADFIHRLSVDPDKLWEPFYASAKGFGGRVLRSALENKISKHPIALRVEEATGYRASFPEHIKISREEMLKKLEGISKDIGRLQRGSSLDVAERAFFDVVSSELVTTGRAMSGHHLAATAIEESSAFKKFATKRKAAKEVAEKHDVVAPKYEKLTLPGGENYQETLITLPHVKTNDELATQLYGKEMRFLDEQERAHVSYTQRKRFRPDFTESHHDVPNVLLHIRHKDRVDTKGRKILFVEEIQSDWHQQGRERGYQVDSGRILDELKKFGLNPSMTLIPDPHVWEELGIPDNVINRLRPQHEALLKQSTESVPDAPFKKTQEWTGLAVKRIMRMAADEGYDGVAFIRGVDAHETSRMPIDSAIEFYDKILPSVVKSETGVSAGRLSLTGAFGEEGLRGAYTTEFRWVEMTPELKARMLKPQPLLGKAEEVGEAVSAGKKVVEPGKGKRAKKRAAARAYQEKRAAEAAAEVQEARHWTELTDAPVGLGGRTSKEADAAMRQMKTGDELADFIAKNSDDPVHRSIAKRIMPHLKDTDVHVVSKMEDLPEHILKADKKGALSASFVNSLTFLMVHPSRVIRGSIRGGLNYSPKGDPFNDVFLRGGDRISPGTNSETALHELIHAATVRRVSDGNLVANRGTKLHKATAELFDLANEVVASSKQMQKTSPDELRGLIDLELLKEATKNEKEFIAYGLSNREFQDYLMTIKVGDRSAWTRFVERIAEILGLPGDESNALTELLRITDDILDAPLGELKDRTMTEMLSEMSSPKITGAVAEAAEAGAKAVPGSVGAKGEAVTEGAPAKPPAAAITEVPKEFKGKTPRLQAIIDSDRYVVVSKGTDRDRTRFDYTTKGTEDWPSSTPYLVDKKTGKRLDYDRTESRYNPDIVEAKPHLSIDYEEAGIVGDVRQRFRYEITPKEGWLKSLPQDDSLMYRGMSWEEWQDIQKTGKIQSKGEYNLGPEQVGLTYFSSDVDNARHYADGFTPVQFKATPDKPAVVVAVKKRPGVKVEGTGEHEIGITDDISSDEIVSVWEGHVGETSAGMTDVVADFHGIRDGSGSGVSNVIFWKEGSTTTKPPAADVATAGAKPPAAAASKGVTVYHGSPAEDIAAFDVSRAGEKEGGLLPGISFSKNPSTAEHYRPKDPVLKPEYREEYEGLLRDEKRLKEQLLAKINADHGTNHTEYGSFMKDTEGNYIDSRKYSEDQALDQVDSKLRQVLDDATSDFPKFHTLVPSGKLYEAKVDLQEPFLFDAKGGAWSPDMDKKILQQMREVGGTDQFDGVIIKDVYDGKAGDIDDIYVVFDTDRITTPKPPAADVATAGVKPPAAAVVKTETPEFKKWFRELKKWFGESKVVDEAGEPLVVYHGTPHVFDKFEPGSVEGAFGSSIYFSDSADDVSRNYARLEGPDIRGRADRAVDQIESLADFDEIDILDAASGLKQTPELRRLIEAEDVDALMDLYEPDIVEEMARRMVLGDQQFNVLPVYLRMENPVYLDPSGKKGRTVFEMEYVYDEAGDIVDETGPAVRLFETMDEVAHEFDAVDEVARLKESLFDDLADGEIDASTLMDRIREGDYWIHDPDTGDIANTEFMRTVFERMGFDGVVADAHYHFGPKKGFGGVRLPGMEGVKPGTYHYMAFKPTQIKSKFNRGTFDPTDPRILYGAGFGAGAVLKRGRERDKEQ